MVVAVEKATVDDIKEPTEVLHLVNRDCGLSGDLNETFYVKEFGYKECGTNFAYDEDNPDYVEFCNALMASTPGGDYLSGLTVPIICEISVRSQVQSSYKPSMQSNALDAQLRLDNFSLTMKSYNDTALVNNFAELAEHTIVETNAPVYMSLETTSFHHNMKLILQTCYASDSDSQIERKSYTLLRNHCVVDETFKITRVEDKITYFEFLSFRFQDANNLNTPNYETIVYIHCGGYLCQIGTEGCTNTTQLCETDQTRARHKRSRRDAQSNRIPRDKTNFRIETYGPFKIESIKAERERLFQNFVKSHQDMAMKVYKFCLSDNLLYALSFMTIFMLLVTFITHFVSARQQSMQREEEPADDN